MDTLEIPPPPPIVRPMWCDDFDMDLPKIFPQALDLLGDLAGIELVTHGSLTDGALNHPCVWNSDLGCSAFFGFRHPMKPASHYTDSPIVRCSAWEAFRDIWSHSIAMVVEGRFVVWNTGPLEPHFDTIMGGLRGWHRRDGDVAEARRTCLKSYVRAIGRLRDLAQSYGHRSATA